MFGMSVTEIGIILVLALLLLGPDELPKVAKTVGKALRELRKTTDDLKSTFEQEMVRLDDEPQVTPALVPPPLDSSATPATGALDQLRDPAAARAAARMLALPPDPGSARAAARLAAAGLAPAEGAGSEATASGSTGSGATGSGTPDAGNMASPDSAFWSEGNGHTPDAPAPVAAPGTADESLESIAASTSARDAAPSPRAPPSDTVPREKKSGPAA
jgi:sec-independent protein translocase protein TatB